MSNALRKKIDEALGLIPALGYLRKSTKGERVDPSGKKRQRQEKSIHQQKTEILTMAEGRYRVVAWFVDEGVSGWKRGIKRPDFTRMLAEAQSLGAQCILVDNIDRLSRAAVDEVQEDAGALRKAGVRWIVTAAQGEYDLGARYDIGHIIKFVAAVWASCEFSRQLGRRVALAKRNKALEGKRCGGYAPYGLEDDGKGGCKPGDPDKWKRVKWLFEQVDQRRTVNSLCSELNARGIRSPRGGKWRVKSIGNVILRNRTYRGDFSYSQGQFYRLDDKGEVVDKDDVKAPGDRPGGEVQEPD
jgi:DNA invertase Pin-like site-specific DNA recombinase